jgi:hypothetical protein
MATNKLDPDFSVFRNSILPQRGEIPNCREQAITPTTTLESAPHGRFLRGCECN